MRKLIPIRRLKKRAEAVFHEWICKRDKFVCYTCNKPGNQAGHFRHNKLDFDEMNLHCQCTYCNCYAHGQLGIYALKMVEQYGKKAVDELVLRSNTTLNKFTREQLEELIKRYS